MTAHVPDEPKKKIDVLSGQASFSSTSNMESNSSATRIQPTFVTLPFKEFLDDRLSVFCLFLCLAPHD